MGLNVVILAAGKGKRMVSDLPKVLHKIGGLPMLEHVVNTAKILNATSINVVYGNGGSIIRDHLQHLDVNWIEQAEQLGTGHAVSQALPFLNDDDQVLVLYGDVPLISASTLRQLAEETPHNGLGLVVAELDNPTGFGRIIRNEVGYIKSIIEHKDANEVQRQIKEINTGILTTSAKHLKSWLPRLQNNNMQREYYLTDVVALAVGDGFPVGGIMAHTSEEVQGVNDRWQLAHLERYYQLSMAKRLAYAGVTIKDPHRLEIRGTSTVEQDATLDVNIVMEGRVEIGKGSVIGPNCVLKDCKIGRNVTVLANSVIEGAVIEQGAAIGPFARVRPGSIVGKNAKVGNFVEMKKTTLGEGSKASHLTYLGDAVIGEGVNIGAGTITCNYDGVNKYQTIIKDGAFIGSNSALVAPVTIGQGAFVGAGSTVSKDAPDDELTVARAKQMTVKGWKSPISKPKEEV